MAGLTHSNDTTGKDRRRYGFRHFFDAYMSGQALGPLLSAQYGKERRAYHLTADYTWGWTQESSMKGATEKQGWQTVTTVRTPLGATDYSQYLTPVLNSGADVLVLNGLGLEDWLDRALKSAASPQLRIVRVSDGLEAQYIRGLPVLLGEAPAAEGRAQRHHLIRIDVGQRRSPE